MRPRDLATSSAPRPSARGAFLVTFVLLVTSLVACAHDGTPCYPGDYVACACPDGARGYSQCGADGQAYGACDCSGEVPGLPRAAGDAGADGAAPGAGLVAFMGSCERDEQCTTGRCFAFNAKGARCTVSCKSASDCPAPSTGCNNQGVCKAP